MARDRRATRQLRGRGWKVIRIWQLPSAVYAVLRLSVSPEACLNRIRRALTNERGSGLALCFPSTSLPPSLTVGRLANYPTMLPPDFQLSPRISKARRAVTIGMP